MTLHNEISFGGNAFSCLVAPNSAHDAAVTSKIDVLGFAEKEVET